MSAPPVISKIPKTPQNCEKNIKIFAKTTSILFIYMV